MTRLIALLFLLFAIPAVALCDDDKSMSLSIKITTGERGRDSNSTTTSIAISGESIVYKVTYGGRNRGRLPEQNKEFKLESADQKRLVDVIKNKNLLVTESITGKEEEKGNSYYFALSLSPEINGSKGTISIKGLRKATDIKESELYKNATALIEMVYEIIHRSDKKIVYESLIH